MKLLPPKTTLFALTLRTRSLTKTYLSASSSSSFQPPPPPTSKGQPIYDDIDFSHASSPTSEAYTRNSDPNAVFVINGSSRGIGLEYVKQLMSRTKGQIVACCRSPATATQLDEYISSSPSDDQNRIEVLPLDVRDQSQIEHVGTEIKRHYNRVDGLFNVAGLLGDGSTTPGPERSLSKLNRDWVELTFGVNVIGPMMLSKELFPMMRTTSKKDPRAKSVIVNMSARVGSISDNELGGWYSYRCSKAALNQYTRTMSHEGKRYGIWTVALHPGTTNTDLSKPFQRNVKEERLFPVKFTVERMLNVVDSMEERHSGGLFDWAGKALPY